MKSIAERIAEELNVKAAQVAAAIGLLDQGSTVPFIARYRKEATGALDDTQLRALEARLAYLRELEDRRRTILNSIREQGKLDAALEAAINELETKARLEDIYLPFKPKRRTKAQIARENGLGPLADALLSHPEREPLAQAEAYVKPDAVKTAQEALEGARAILAERFAEDAELIGRLREDFWKGGRIVSKVREGKEAAGAKFADYFDFFEPLAKIPSHRALALMRGEREEILDLRLVPDPDADPGARALEPFERAIAHRFGIADRGRPGDRWLLDTARWAWRTKIETQLAVDLRLRVWTQAEDQAVKVLRPTCATSCSPRLRADGRRSASIRAFAPGSRSRSSTRPARSSRRRRSTRTSRSADGTRASPCSPPSLIATGRTSSPSATARPRARRTSSPAISSPAIRS